MAHHPNGKSIIEPDGLCSKAAKLPSVTTKRWVIRRKAQVVAAVREGVLSLEEACGRYMLTVDEFVAWERAIDEHGPPRPANDASSGLSRGSRSIASPRVASLIVS